jgi:hypothetical protein
MHSQFMDDEDFNLLEQDISIRVLIEDLSEYGLVTDGVLSLKKRVVDYDSEFKKYLTIRFAKIDGTQMDVFDAKVADDGYILPPLAALGNVGFNKWLELRISKCNLAENPNCQLDNSL